MFLFSFFEYLISNFLNLLIKDKKNDLRRTKGKIAFIIFVEDNAFRNKIKNICSVMEVSLFSTPDLNKLKENMLEIKNEIFEASDLLNQMNYSILDLLNSRIGDVYI